MIRVLFVCLGNICRSPLAEAVFRHKLKQQNLDPYIEVDSAGTGGWHIGNPPHEGTRKVLSHNQVSFEGIVARQIAENDLKKFDYIIAMDLSNIENMKKLTNEFPESKVFRLMDFVKEAKEVNIPDPYFTGNFDEVYSMIEEGCTHLLEYMIAKNHLDVK